MSTDVPWILVVDDEVDTCRNLSDILTDLGYRVDTAHDGPSALELVRHRPYDVALLLRERGFRIAVAHDEAEAAARLEDRRFSAVLIDMKLPRGDGSRVFQLVRHTNPQARTVVITGHRSEMDRLIQKVVGEGADAVCYKPFDIPKLLDTLHHLTNTPADRPGAKP